MLACTHWWYSFQDLWSENPAVGSALLCRQQEHMSSPKANHPLAHSFERVRLILSSITLSARARTNLIRDALVTEQSDLDSEVFFFPPTGHFFSRRTHPVLFSLMGHNTQRD